MSRKREADISFDLSDLLALHGPGSISIEISPGVHLSIDSFALEERKQDLVSYCRSISPDEYVTWRGLLPRMDGNETMAKLLIALGDEVGAWVRHPPINLPTLWTSEHPMVLVQADTSKRSVPKPSAGDLERGLVTCAECGLRMGPFGSTIHDYVEAEPGSRCISYDPGLCEMAENGHGRRSPERRKTPKPPDPAKSIQSEVLVPHQDISDNSDAPSWVKEYMSSLNDE